MFVAADLYLIYKLSPSARVFISDKDRLLMFYLVLKKLINNSRGKYKRNECLINVCKSDTDLS